jgi:hypothetical protein
MNKQLDSAYLEPQSPLFIDSTNNSEFWSLKDTYKNETARWPTNKDKEPLGVAFKAADSERVEMPRRQIMTSEDLADSSFIYSDWPTQLITTTDNKPPKLNWLNKKVYPLIIITFILSLAIGILIGFSIRRH